MLHPINARPVRDLESKGATVVFIPVVGHKFCGVDEPPRLIGKVSVVPEPDNPVDPDAIAVYEDGAKVGYITRKHMLWIHNLISGHLSHVREDEAKPMEEVTLPVLFLNVEADSTTGLDYGALAVVGLDSAGNVEPGSCMWTPVGDVKV